MTKLLCGLAVAFCGISTVPLVASSDGAASDGPVSSFDQLWTKVKSGDTVYVLDTHAQETPGTLAKVSQTSIAVLVDGQIQEIAIGEVRQVARRGDRLWNGALMGATFGVVASVVASNDGCWSEDMCTPSVAERMGMAIVLGGVYSAIGAGIDALIHGRTVVYRSDPQTTVRVMPVLSRHDAGARLSIGF